MEAIEQLLCLVGFLKWARKRKQNVYKDCVENKRHVYFTYDAFGITVHFPLNNN